MDKSKQFSSEVRERAVRLVQEHRGEYPSLWAAVESIAPKIGCVPQTLLEWIKRVESVELATLEWVSWFNDHRLMEPLIVLSQNSQPPAPGEPSKIRPSVQPVPAPTRQY